MAKELNIANLGGAKITSAGIKAKLVDEDEELTGLAATQYRSIVARANFLAIDKIDIQFEVKELARSMAKPTASAWEKSIRLGKYLPARPRFVQLMKRHGDTHDKCFRRLRVRMFT